MLVRVILRDECQLTNFRETGFGSGVMCFTDVSLSLDLCFFIFLLVWAVILPIRTPSARGKAFVSTVLPAGEWDVQSVVVVDCGWYAGSLHHMLGLSLCLCAVFWPSHWACQSVVGFVLYCCFSFRGRLRLYLYFISYSCHWYAIILLFALATRQCCDHCNASNVRVLWKASDNAVLSGCQRSSLSLLWCIRAAQWVQWSVSNHSNFVLSCYLCSPFAAGATISAGRPSSHSLVQNHS